MKEFDRISAYFAPLSIDGLCNDGAVLTVSESKKLVVTTDTIIENVHFLPATPAHLVAQKALRTNLSDLAAMGATPLAYSLALSLSSGIMHEEWLSDFSAGLKKDQKTYNITLLGGDTTAHNGPLVITITAHGVVDDGALTRSGAKIGDDVYVTGTIGDGALGLHCIQNKIEEPSLINRYHLPKPRLTIAQKLHGIATTCLDISDGLLQDAGHIAQQSNIGMHINAPHIPLSAPAAALIEKEPLLKEKIYNGGDDYELLFTAPPSTYTAIADIAKATATPVTCIGQCVAGNGVTLLSEEGKEVMVECRGWVHGRSWPTGRAAGTRATCRSGEAP